MVLTDIGCLHTVHITNISENEVFSYPLILIKGYITGNCKHDIAKCVTVKCINEQNVETASYLTQNCKFKVLLYLKEGKNSFVLQYCSVYKELVLFYKLPFFTHVVKPIYIICEDHNGLFQAPEGYDNSVESACKRIGICARLLQTIFSEKLYEHGYGRKTFQLATNPDCLTFYSKLSVKQIYSMSPYEIWEYLGREIMTSSISSTHCKFLAFLSCTFWNGDTLYAHVALGGGGLALFGTGCLYTWPTTFEEIVSCFTNDTKVDTEHFMDDSNFRGTYGGCFSTTLGAVCHELGHAFDLGHSKDGIMGCGYFDVDSVFTFRNVVNDTVTGKSFSFTQNRNTVSCLRGSNKSLILPTEGFTRELNVSYHVSHHSKKVTKDIDFTIRAQKPSTNGKQLDKAFSVDRLYFTYSYATLLYYHRWFNAMLVHDIANDLKYDSNRGIVRSSAGIVVVQLRNDEGYVLRSWEFLSHVKRVIFLVPLYEVRRANIIFIEDTVGNMIKEQVQLVS